MLDVDVQPQMWDAHWTRFFKSQVAPNHAHRGKALDFSVLLKLELLRFGRQFNWTAFEDLGDYFERLKTEYPIDRIPGPLIAEFVRLYRHCRFHAAEFSETDSDQLINITTEILDILQQLRKYMTATGASSANFIADQVSDQSINRPIIPSNEPILPQPLNKRETKEEKLLRERGGPKKFPKGYELLESDGSMAGGSGLGKKDRIGSFSRFRKTPGSRKEKTPSSSIIPTSTSWEEQVPLQVFHDNPLIHFEPGPSTSSA